MQMRGGSGMTERVIKSEEVVVRSLLERGASRSPDEILVSFEDGGTLTRAEALGTAYAFANELSARGIRRDDRVLVMLPNGADFLRVWWGSHVWERLSSPRTSASAARCCGIFWSCRRPR